MEFFRACLQDPPLFFACLMTLGVIFVNGWTDAPNAIASAVSSGAMREKSAVLLAAVCNLLGTGISSLCFPTVAVTVYRMADLGSEPERALSALAAALFAILLWSVVCWGFGIPTSESHGLIAGITGAVLALGGGSASIDWRQWSKAAWGLVFSLAAGFSAGYLCARLTKRIAKSAGAGFYRGAQIFGAGAMAFLHGAQDGQKFLALFLLAASFGPVFPGTGSAFAPGWLILLCALLMALGTACGGGRIIRTVGFEMVRLSPAEGFSADTAGAFCLLWASLCGIPVSTTHVKATAMMGAGLTGGRDQVDKATVKELMTAWILTFPACLLLSFLSAKAALFLFGH